MKKRYQAPRADIYHIVGKTYIGVSVVLNSTEKVENNSDIGFVKGQKSQGYDVWHDDWSR